MLRLTALLVLLQCAFGFLTTPTRMYSQPRSLTARMSANSNENSSPGLTGLIPSSPLDTMKRNGVIPMAIGLTALVPIFSSVFTANAADSTAPTSTPEKVDLGPPPKDFALKNDYYKDCQQVVDHMRYAVQLEKGNPVLAEVASKTKDEMNEFVAFYRRFDGINGRQSFSLLYTSINVLAGHYTSYGVKFPVPEKRRKRLLQEFNDIEKNIRKKR